MIRFYHDTKAIVLVSFHFSFELNMKLKVALRSMLRTLLFTIVICDTTGCIYLWFVKYGHLGAINYVMNGYRNFNCMAEDCC